MPNKLLFLTLKVFSATGGIEKVCRVAGKALYEISAGEGLDFRVLSIYDRREQVDLRYFPADRMTGFGGSKKAFIRSAVREGRGATAVLLSHINLLPVGYAIKKLSPATRVVLIAHGIEVWAPLPAWKRRMLQSLDLVLPISRFTKEKLASLHGLPAVKLPIVNNCLDPYLPPPATGPKNEALLQRYGLTKDHKVLFTLARLSSAERYKGYDEIIMALKSLNRQDRSYRYLVAGKWDAEEKARLDRLVEQQGVKDAVIFAGFVPDEELVDHFNLADVYVMPSRGEGFGIVFIEALYYGLPVIAGNCDGSPDALAGGKFGYLVNPTSVQQISRTVTQMIRNGDNRTPDKKSLEKRFGFFTYSEALRKALLPNAKAAIASAPADRQKNERLAAPAE